MTFLEVALSPKRLKPLFAKVLSMGKAFIYLLGRKRNR
jgi:hypothetical protein